MFTFQRPVPSALLHQLRETYPTIQMQIAGDPGRDVFCQVRIDNPGSLLDASPREILDEMIEMQKCDPGQEFMVSKAFLDKLIETDPGIELELSGRYPDFDLYIFTISNADSFPEPPEITERIRQIVAQARRNPATRFFETQEVYGGLRRTYATKNPFRPRIQTEGDYGDGIYAFCILNAKSLRDPPKAATRSAPVDRGSPQGPSDKEAEHIEMIQEMMEIARDSPTPQRFVVPLDLLQTLGEIYPPIEITIKGIAWTSEEYEIEIPVPKPVEGFSGDGELAPMAASTSASVRIALGTVEGARRAAPQSEAPQALRDIAVRKPPTPEDSPGASATKEGSSDKGDDGAITFRLAKGSAPLGTSEGGSGPAPAPLGGGDGSSRPPPTGPMPPSSSGAPGSVPGGQAGSTPPIGIPASGPTGDEEREAIDEEGDVDPPAPPPPPSYEDPLTGDKHKIGEVFNSDPGQWSIVTGPNQIRLATVAETVAFLADKYK